jgi:hypothetical protein
MKKNKDGPCQVKGIPGTTNQPKMQGDQSKPIANAVAMSGMKSQGLSRIKGAVSGPK